LKKIAVLIVVLVLSLTTILVACSSEETTPTTAPTTAPTNAPTAAPPKTLKMAALLPLSGPVAGWGVTLAEGCQWWADEINEQGGFKVGNDIYKIDLQTMDNEYSGTVSATLGARIVDEGIHYIYGPQGYDGERACGPIFTPAKVFAWGMSSAEYLKTAVPAGYKYQLGGSYPNWAWFGALIPMAIELTPGVKTVAMLNSDDDFGHLASEQIHAVMDKYGIQVDEKFYAPGTQDFYPVLTPLLNKNPDVFYTGHSVAGDMALQIKQARELGWTKTIWAGSSAWSKLVSIAGLDALEGIKFVYTDYKSDVWPQGVRDASARYLASHPGKTELDFLVLLSYETINIYKQAMQRAGSIDPDEVLKVFDDPNFTFTFFGDPNATLGGFETYGARRQTQSYIAYGEIINGVPVQRAIRQVEIP